MAWIESHQSLRDHRKTKRMARRLGIPRIYVVGHLHGVWWWALDNAPKGFVCEDDLPSIAEAAEWTGDWQEFVETLIYAEFAERADGGVIIHDWDEYAGKLLEQRQANADRQRRYRERRRDGDVTHDNEERNALRNADITVTSPLRNAATGPNPTQPDHESITHVIDDATLPKRDETSSNAAHAAPPGGGNHSPKATAKKERPKHDKASHNAMFESIIETYGIDLDAINRTERGMVNAVATNLLDSHLTPDDVPRLKAKIQVAYPTMGTIPPTMLPKYVYLLKEPERSPAKNGHVPPEPQYRPADTEEERAEKIRKELEWAAEHTIPPSYMRTRTNGASSHRASATSRGEFSPRSEDT